MGEWTSFEDLIKSEYYNEIYSALEAFVEDNPGRLEVDCYSVQSPEEAEMVDFTIIKTTIKEVGEYDLQFDVLVSTEITVAETIKRNRTTDEIEQWFMVSANGTLDEGIKNFRVEDVTVYNKSRGISKGLLTDQLVPVISKDMFDEEAEDFLRIYYPVALEKPMALPVKEVVAIMGLDVREIHITRNGAIFGKIFFANCETEYFDTTTRTHRLMNVTKGTLFVDPKVYFMRNVGSMNNTIIHECIHWHKHRKFHELVKLYNKNAQLISCRVNESRRNKKTWTPIDWMEWQANGIAPRILMPASTTRLKIEELLEKNRKILPDAKYTDLLESVMFELAAFFQVSNISAKIRMIDLGYEEAIGVHTYVNDGFISNYAFQQGALKRNQTFVISTIDACREYVINPEFRKYIDSGRYLYVEGHFCINDTKYVRETEDGSSELTDYAKEHIDECCLIFDIRFEDNKKYAANQYIQDIMYRDLAEEQITYFSFNKAEHNGTIDERAANLDCVREDLKWTIEIMRELPADFGETLVYLMKKRGVSERVLADRTMLNEKDIQRLRNRGTRPKLNKLVAVCIGLNLTPQISAEMLKKAGLTLMMNEEEQAYQMLLNSCYDMSIYDCNNILAELGFDPLTKE